MTYIDRLKYERFSENCDRYLQRANIINFDIKHHRCRGDELINPVTYYKTIKKHELNDFKKKEKEEPLAGVARGKRKDLWAQRDLMINYFKKFVVLTFFTGKKCSQ